MLHDRNNTRRTESSGSGRSRTLYVNRDKKKKHKKLITMIVAWAIFIAIAALAIFGVVKGIQLLIGLFTDDYAFEYTVPENWTECANISEIKKDYAIGIQYPLINEQTNKTLTKDVKEMLNEFKKEIKQFERGKDENRAVYTANYSVTKNSETYMSVLFTIHRVNPLRLVDDIQYISKIYDTTTGQAVNAEDIFDEGYVSIASDYVTSALSADSKYVEKTTTNLFIDNTKPKFENFSNIGFNGKVMTLYFSAGDIFSTDMGALTIDIPLYNVYQNMKINITGYTAPLYDVDKPMIALTFDDGPNPTTSTRILDALESVGGRATFFVIGERVSQGSDVIIRGDKMGCEYGNHTWSHVNLAKSSEQEIADQINKTDDALYSIIGKESPFIRAPYAATNDTVFSIADKPFVGWTVDTMDWKTRDASSIKAELLNNTDDGDIILMHDIYGETASAIEEVIHQLSAEGYQLVTVGELLEAREIIPTAGKVYYSAPKK